MIDYKYIKLVPLINTNYWDYYTLSNVNTIDSKFPLIKLKEVLNYRKGFIQIDDDELYKRCRVQIKGRGVILRDEVLGKEIKTKKQQICKSNDFLVAEIDAKVGGYGIVDDNLEGAIVSGHYFLFDINRKKLSPQYLGVVVKQEQFSKQVKSTGSTNYAAIRPYHVLEYQIPLPSLTEQQRLVEKYYKKINQAKKLKQESNNLEEEIENFFLQQLGLQPFASKQKSNKLQVTDYVTLERWDFFSTDTRISVELNKSKFNLSSIGKSFHFARRPFNKSLYTSETFKYVEIGSIDSTKGILQAKQLLVQKAPSRATQLIRTGDLIIGTTRPYLKKFAIVTEEHDGNICSSGFSVIEPSEEYHLPYLNQFLKCIYGIEQLKNKMTGGLYPAITETGLREVKIPFPDIETQKEIMVLIEEKKQSILNNINSVIIMESESEKEFANALFN